MLNESLRARWFDKGDMGDFAVFEEIHSHQSSASDRSSDVRMGHFAWELEGDSTRLPGSVFCVLKVLVARCDAGLLSIMALCRLFNFGTLRALVPVIRGA